MFLVVQWNAFGAVEGFFVGWGGEGEEEALDYVVCLCCWLVLGLAFWEGMGVKL